MRSTCSCGLLLGGMGRRREVRCLGRRILNSCTCGSYYCSYWHGGQRRLWQHGGQHGTPLLYGTPLLHGHLLHEGHLLALGGEGSRLRLAICNLLLLILIAL